MQGVTCATQYPQCGMCWCAFASGATQNTVCPDRDFTMHVTQHTMHCLPLTLHHTPATGHYELRHRAMCMLMHSVRRLSRALWIVVRAPQTRHRTLCAPHAVLHRKTVMQCAMSHAARQMQCALVYCVFALCSATHIVCTMSRGLCSMVHVYVFRSMQCTSRSHSLLCSARRTTRNT